MSAQRYRVGDLLVDRYLVLESFAGSMGLAYLVEDMARETGDTTPSRMIAKTFRPDLAATTLNQRFLKEASIWINLSPGQNVVQAYRVDTIGETPFVFAEYIEPGVLPNSLETWIHHRIVCVEVALHIAVQLLDGMWYVYQDGVEVHGDLKPSNILLNEDLVVKINDWGFACSTSTAATTEDAEAYVRYHGTSSYLAPEARLGTQSVISRALDGYALGVLLGEMITGRRFGPGTTKEDVRVALEPACIGLSETLVEVLSNVVAGLLTINWRDRRNYYEVFGSDLVAVYKEATQLNVIDDSDAIIIRPLPKGHAERMKQSKSVLERLWKR